MSRIEVSVGDVNLRLLKDSGKGLQVYGTMFVSFNCPNCSIRVRDVLDYSDKNDLNRDRVCGGCGELYRLDSTLHITPPDFVDRETIELGKQVQPLIDKALGKTQ